MFLFITQFISRAFDSKTHILLVTKLCYWTMRRLSLALGTLQRCLRQWRVPLPRYSLDQHLASAKKRHPPLLILTLLFVVPNHPRIWAIRSTICPCLLVIYERRRRRKNGTTRLLISSGSEIGRDNWTGRMWSTLGASQTLCEFWRCLSGTFILSVDWCVKSLM